MSAEPAQQERRPPLVADEGVMVGYSVSHGRAGPSASRFRLAGDRGGVVTSP